MRSRFLYIVFGFLLLFSGCAVQESTVLPRSEPSASAPVPLLDEEVLREEFLRKEKEQQRGDLNDAVAARRLPDGSWEVGSPDAPLVLRLYTDYQCAYCSEFAQRTESRILEEFVSKGLVRYQVTMFPLEKIHTNALSSASAALCAGEQGGFFEMHRKLLGNSFDLGNTQYQKFAGEIGLDQSSFLDCYRSERYRETARAQREEGRSWGVDAVPTLFIGERKVEGVYPYGDVRAWIREALEGR